MKDGEDYVQQPDYYEEAGTVPTIATGYELRPTVAKNVSGTANRVSTHLSDSVNVSGPQLR